MYKLADLVNRYNNTYHKTIKMKPLDVSYSTCIKFGIESNDKNSKFKVDYHVRAFLENAMFQIGVKKFL